MFEVWDDRYGYSGSFQILECTECSHAFLEGEFSSQQLRDLYSNYYPRATFDLKAYQPYQETSGFKAWLDGDKSATFRWVPSNVRVLDIGCGFGESLGYYQSRGCDAYGVEADENIRRVAEKFGYRVHVGLFDPSLYAENSFDYVTMSQVIEHVTDPVETLRGVSRILKPGGSAVLSTPNLKGWSARLFRTRWAHWHAPYHLQLFSLASMRAAAAKAGLSVERSMTVTSSEWLKYQWIHLLTRPLPGEPSPFWSGLREMTTRQNVGVRALSLLHKGKVNHVLTRLIDGVGLGDNRLYFLRKP
jgi:2-polyprenyl-3-methyl-5-hydroxy-6-metoxy-1,4-benzoquinol methylase